MEGIIDRLRTFKHWGGGQSDWLELALCGQYALVPPGVRTRCCHCFVIQENWNNINSILTQHAAYNINCPLVQKYLQDPILKFYYSDSKGVCQDLIRLEELSKCSLTK